MKLTYLIPFIASITIGILTYNSTRLSDNGMVALQINRMIPADNRISLDVQLTNLGNKPYRYEGVTYPCEHMFDVKDLTDSNSVLSNVPISQFSMRPLIIPPKSSQQFSLVYLAILSKGSHLIELSTKNTEAEISTQKKIFLEQDIVCKNFNKWADPSDFPITAPPIENLPPVDESLSRLIEANDEAKHALK